MTLNSIHDLLDRRALVSVSPTDRVSYACQKLAEQNIGAVVVVDANKLVGVLSERDVVSRCMVPGRDAAATEVSQIMTPDPRTILPTGSLAEAQALMLDGGFRHLPVVDRAGEPLGMLSLRDIPSEYLAMADRVREIGQAATPG